MKFHHQFQNDDHFKRHYAHFVCDVKGCGYENSYEINLKRFDSLDLMKCPQCGEFGAQSQKERLIEQKKHFEDKIREIQLQLEIIEMTEKPQEKHREVETVISAAG